MARITQVSDTAAAPEAAALFTAIKGKIGMVPNLYRVAANQPAVLAAMLGLNETLAGGSFDARTREAIALTVAGANACDYCASAHAAISSGLKVAPETIDAHLSGRSDDPRTAAILRLAVAIVAAKGMVVDADLDAARAAGLTEADIVETVANVVANIFTNYLNHVADTDIDFPARKARAA
ncbi:MAG TPA: carboxymuconolactone decarboxylase family protein [Amaricoccus sp.]|uniref:carboxymuconolactone decarboxylase family protein n=1 Tax=Amaricoccus sp. TaxID=1872485 RepID=UPI002BBEF7FB|nr:carboxymuconolactone decarboxylase family protein [Amaricoccus sp.]HMQ93468.1 carboxymuconolactone decarboxylase family protein [Amaricoccus sp.]HMR53671.1 carboxymuconolactone decarboxylase family protein [Amaricoccus sp.]HMU00731.1 carboxymuconolactone decarboxylase family protein [Amaricoccus sp.]